MQITYLRNPVTGSPDWSPDGRRLVFDSREGEEPQLYISSADGGPSKRLPTGKGLSVVPHWSPEGRNIYFSSDRSGRMEIWRSPSDGGGPEQVTQDGGFGAIFSRDGQAIYYTSNNAPISSLWMLHLTTGKRALVSSTALRRGYAASVNGAYFFTGSTNQKASTLYYLDRESGEKRLVFRTDRRVSNGMTLGPDDHTLYYTQAEASNQLFLVQDFWH